MKFTDAAKKTFENYLKENNLDGIMLSLAGFSEGESGNIHIELVTKEELKDKRNITVDGLLISVSQEDEHGLEDVTFDSENDEISLLLPEEECHCGHHHHHEGEEGCCCHHEGKSEYCCGEECHCGEE